MSKLLSIFAIQVTHTEKGKQRRGKVWLTRRHNGPFKPSRTSKSWPLVAIEGVSAIKTIAESRARMYFKETGCKCRVMEFVEKKP